MYKNPKPSYIVLISNNVGGAEKRFFDIFKSLSKDHENIFLVLSATLANKLKTDGINNIIVIGKEDHSLLAFLKEYYKWLMKKRNEPASFHYPMNCLFFLHYLMPHNLSMSLTNCYYAPTLFTLKRSLIRQYLTMLFVKRIDILSPSIYEIVSKYKLISSKKISLTPNGTYIFPTNIINTELNNKETTYGFIGRLVAGKGVDKLLSSIPSIWEGLDNKEISFFIAGYGALETEVKMKIQELKKLGIPINFLGYMPAEEILKSAKIIFSVQEVTNYPSRVVAEAMLNGCKVLVTDSGDSRNFGIFKNGLSYIKANLSPAEIIEQINLTEACFQSIKNYPLIIREEGLEAFSNSKVIDYFYNILNNS